MSGTRFKLISAVHIFLMQEDRVLLMRRFNTGYEDGRYSVPAGHLDGDEPVTTAAVREAFEELGIVVLPDDLSVVHVMHRRVPESVDERIDFFLRARTWEGRPTIKEPDKCDDLRWSPVTELPTTVIPYVRFALQSHGRDERYSEFGWHAAPSDQSGRSLVTIG